MSEIISEIYRHACDNLTELNEIENRGEDLTEIKENFKKLIEISKNYLNSLNYLNIFSAIDTINEIIENMLLNNIYEKDYLTMANNAIKTIIKNITEKNIYYETTPDETTGGEMSEDLNELSEK